MNKKNSFDKQHQLEDLEFMLQSAVYQVEREAVFAEVANLRFEKNLKAFQAYFPEIYEKYLHYQPSEKFELLVNDNGSANLIDYDVGVPIYSEDPVEQCREQVEHNINSPILGIADHSGVQQIENDADFKHIELMRCIGTVYNETKTALPHFRKLGKSIPSVMVFGIGLGYHLPGIIDACRAGYVNFFEPNEDYFFASLFVADWDYILNKVDENGSYLYLGIGLTEAEIYQEFYSRTRAISVASICHAWFYQHYPSINVNKWISEFKRNYHQFFAGFGFFDDALIGVAHTLGNVDNSIAYLSNVESNVDTISQMPAVIVANGPSLDAEIDFLKSIRHKVIIFSCNSASTALVKNGLIPDFHVALERTEETYDFLKEHLPAAARENINLLIPNVMHPKVAGLFKWTGAALKPGEAGTQLIQLAQYRKDKGIIGSLSYCNPLVGNTALSFACHLGFKEIYLFGVDNGYIDENHHHSRSSFYYDDKGDEKVKPFKIGKEIRIPGNFVSTVLTDEFMNVGNVQMERILQSFKNQGVVVFNCSNGAKIEHTYPLPSESIILNDDNAGLKAEVIQFITDKKFKVFNDKDAITSLLAFDEFDDFCRTMAGILSQNVETREEALFVLLESLRYLYSFRNSAPYLSLYLLLEGEALYTCSILLSLLFNFGDEENIIPNYKKALQYWIDFINEAPQYYRDNYDKCK